MPKTGDSRGFGPDPGSGVQDPRWDPQPTEIIRSQGAPIDHFIRGRVVKCPRAVRGPRQGVPQIWDFRASIFDVFFAEKKKPFFFQVPGGKMSEGGLQMSPFRKTDFFFPKISKRNHQKQPANVF